MMMIETVMTLPLIGFSLTSAIQSLTGLAATLRPPPAQQNMSISAPKTTLTKTALTTSWMWRRPRLRSLPTPVWLANTVSLLVTFFLFLTLFFLSKYHRFLSPFCLLFWIILFSCYLLIFCLFVPLFLFYDLWFLMFSISIFEFLVLLIFNFWSFEVLVSLTFWSFKFSFFIFCVFVIFPFFPLFLISFHLSVFIFSSFTATLPKSNQSNTGFF